MFSRLACRVRRDAWNYYGAHAKRSIDEYNVRMNATLMDGRRVLEGRGCGRNRPEAASYLEPEPAERRGNSEEIIILEAFGGGLDYFRFTYDCDSGDLGFWFGALL